jgi:hypothetical protein
MIGIDLVGISCDAPLIYGILIVFAENEIVKLRAGGLEQFL